MGDDSGPTIITRQTIRVRSNDGTPVTITKINIHSGRNINGGDDRLTPFDLMRIADSRMNDFFEALIIRHLQLFNAIEREEEKEREKEKEKENNNNENKKGENNNKDKYYDNYDGYNDKYYKNKDRNYNNYDYYGYGGKKGYKGGYDSYNDYDYGKSYKKKNYYKGGYK